MHPPRPKGHNDEMPRSKNGFQGGWEVIVEGSLDAGKVDGNFGEGVC
jgi:hypothetical protein